MASNSLILGVRGDINNVNSDKSIDLNLFVSMVLTENVVGMVIYCCLDSGFYVNDMVKEQKQDY